VVETSKGLRLLVHALAVGNSHNLVILKLKAAAVGGTFRCRAALRPRRRGQSPGRRGRAASRGSRGRSVPMATTAARREVVRR
jgi:hypothetical protein